MKRLEVHYKELSPEDREKMCIAIALGRHVVWSLDKRTNEDGDRLHHNTFRDFYFRYCRWDDAHTPPTFPQNKRGDNIITIDDLKEFTILQDWGYILNTDGICFDVSEYIREDVIRYYVESRFEHNFGGGTF